MPNLAQWTPLRRGIGRIAFDAGQRPYFKLKESPVPQIAEWDSTLRIGTVGNHGILSQQILSTGTAFIPRNLSWLNTVFTVDAPGRI
jgi:hypothetical protein